MLYSFYQISSADYHFHVNHYRPKRRFGQGNVFTPVCHSVHGGGGYPSMPCRSVRGVSQHALQFSPRGVSNFGGGVPACLAVQSQGGLQFFGGGWGVEEGKGGPPNFFWEGEFFFDFCFLWGYPPPPCRDQTPEYSQRSAGTHPIGMHSCCI